jgi:hypothetical protein
MTRHYKAEDFDPQPRVMRYFWVVVVLLAIAILCMIAFAMGDRRGYENGKAHAAIATRIVPAANPTAPLIPCSHAGRLEHDRVCRARLRSGKVGP